VCVCVLLILAVVLEPPVSLLEGFREVSLLCEVVEIPFYSL